MQGHPATLRKTQREAAERELAKKGKTLKDYPWPEDAAPEFRGSRAERRASTRNILKVATHLEDEGLTVAGGIIRNLVRERDSLELAFKLFNTIVEQE